MSMIGTIREAWGWCGLEPVEVEHQNAFGNLIVRDANAAFWRICPEELSAEQICCNEGELTELMKSDQFIEDWAMDAMVREARRVHGDLSEGRVYCLKAPAVLGGAYEADNYGTILLSELISFSGDVAQQIKDLPEGAQIELDFT
ncbi:MAG: T6SS immunity protein Tdi1 domain-containing protein [Planctomycetota bacterium]